MHLCLRCQQSGECCAEQGIMFHTIFGQHDVAVLESDPSAYVSARIHLHHLFERSRTAFLLGLHFDGEYLRSDLGDDCKYGWKPDENERNGAEGEPRQFFPRSLSDYSINALPGFFALSRYLTVNDSSLTAPAGSALVAGVLDTVIYSFQAHDQNGFSSAQECILNG